MKARGAGPWQLARQRRNRTAERLFRRGAGTKISVAEKPVEVAVAVDDAKDQGVVIFDAIDDDIFAHGEAAASVAEILITGRDRYRGSRQAWRNDP